MNKPITVAREEFIKSIIQTVQDSGLPAFVVVDVLEGVCRESKALAQQQYQADLKAYQDNQVIKEATKDE